MSSECPKCGRDGALYFDAGLGCYVCSYCDYTSKGYYFMPNIKRSYSLFEFRFWKR